MVDITYKLPNKHYIPVDMSYYNNTQNVSPPEAAEVFTPVAAPRLECMLFFRFRFFFLVFWTLREGSES